MPPFAIDLSHPDFRTDAKKAGKRHPSLLTEDIPELIDKLLEYPELGDRIPSQIAEARKSRVGVRQQNLGPRGAYRLIYLVDRAAMLLRPLALYYKPDIPDMSRHELLTRLTRR